tara:strand:- start:169 stop:504 length:336 start_codon:yes stop_codon:yes gene_type:complete
MTVEWRLGAKFKNGLTWHESVPFTWVRKHMTCYELRWDDDGKVERTGRYALLESGAAEKTQQVSTNYMLPDLDNDDPRLVTEDEYRVRWRQLNNLKPTGGIPGRFEIEPVL